MSIAVEQGVIRLKGNCGADDVEPLLAAVDKDRRLKVDLSDADHLSAAIFQVLQTFKQEIVGSPRDTFVRTWLIPILKSDPSDRPDLATPKTSSRAERP